ncbi:DUF732 domain-containing protein [Mycolicibacter engbaekii]|uniref:DUF732 domain-containing protein n=1 Tax=Mycolicibacter engbaekii TaxID=188915 RepID=UPI0013FD1767|nr:DUF732 domain-containing protein [Mycolicibacter engbaekii]
MSLAWLAGIGAVVLTCPNPAEAKPTQREDAFVQEVYQSGLDGKPKDILRKGYAACDDVQSRSVGAALRSFEAASPDVGGNKVTVFVYLAMKYLCPETL